MTIKTEAMTIAQWAAQNKASATGASSAARGKRAEAYFARECGDLAAAGLLWFLRVPDPLVPASKARGAGKGGALQCIPIAREQGADFLVTPLLPDAPRCIGVEVKATAAARWSYSELRPAQRACLLDLAQQGLCSGVMLYFEDARAQLIDRVWLPYSTAGLPGESSGAASYELASGVDALAYSLGARAPQERAGAITGGESWLARACALHSGEAPDRASCAVEDEQLIIRTLSKIELRCDPLSRRIILGEQINGRPVRQSFEIDAPPAQWRSLTLAIAPGVLLDQLRTKPAQRDLLISALRSPAASRWARHLL